ncbi:MAG: phosphatidylglycerol lysyltransferase domain-containing protein [Lachnospiraceae bacterium]|nr:phosphatidylglycerol lysyltransferase domain-containing protein [Lachnospiraceae bacterium]
MKEFNTAKEFRWVTPEDRTTIDSFMMKYGGGSCQHSFIAMYGMRGKYGDKYLIDEDVLYVLRTGLSSEKETAFLIPMGESCLSDDGLKDAVEKTASYAHKTGTKLVFNTLEEKAMKRITDLFPGRFSVEEVRDSFEYIHTYEGLVNMEGSKYARRRQDMNSFNKNYGDATRIKIIDEGDIEELKSFQTAWNDDFREYCKATGKKIIDHEHEGIMNTFAHYGELPLSGIVLRINGEIKGYAYGTVISDNVYDVLIEKGDRNIKDIYRPLNRELVRMCAVGHKYINREEDCGDPGLRASKMSLVPEFFLKKYVVREV